MCRINLILIDDNKAEDLLESKGYHLFQANLQGYGAYRKGYCNCGSFVGSLLEKKGMNYHDAVSSSKQEKLDRLYQIKDLMNKPGYLERKREFLKKQSVFIEKLQDFSQHITEYERTRTDEIRKGKDGSNENAAMDHLFNEIGTMFSELEIKPDYQMIRETYIGFLHENDIMNESTRYYLTKEEEEKAFDPGIPLSELLGFKDEPGENLKEEAVEQIELQKESFVIDEVIVRTQNETNTAHLSEYHTYYRLFSDLLEHVPSFRFTTIWSEPGELKEIKTVSLESMTIDDLAFLEFNDMICIKK